MMKAAGPAPRGYSTIGDDVEVMPIGGEKLVMKVDMLVEGTDLPPGMGYRMAARKAVAACVSDFAAKGVRPESFMVSLGIRRGTSQRQVGELARGFRDAAEEWGARLVGGDTNEAGELVIDCAMIGFAKKVVGRGGAKAGDALVVTGPFGLQPAGLKILMEGAKSDRVFRSRATESVLRPTPDLKVGLALGRYLSSGMDSSDGLARSLHSLAEASGVGFEVSTLPTAEGVEKFAKANGLVAQELVLSGGEEYVTVGTVPQRQVSRAQKAVREVGGELRVVGRATKGGKVVLRTGRKTSPIKDEGWTHLG